MGRIKNLILYPFKTPIATSDFLLGTDKLTGKTRNFEVGSLVNLVLSQIGGETGDGNVLVSIGDVILTDGFIEINDAVWRIDGQEYSTSSQTLAIQPAAEGYYRTDVIVGNTSGQLSVIVGVQDEDNPTQPPVVGDLALVLVVNVFGDTVTTITPITGALLKIDEAQHLFYNTGFASDLVWGDKNTYRWLGTSDLTLEGMSVNNSALLYDGRLFTLVNAGNGIITLNIGEGDIPFKTPTNPTLVIGRGEIAVFKYSSLSGLLEFVSLSKSGSASNLDATLAVGNIGTFKDIILTGEDLAKVTVSPYPVPMLRVDNRILGVYSQLTSFDLTLKRGNSAGIHVFRASAGLNNVTVDMPDNSGDLATKVNIVNDLVRKEFLTTATSLTGTQFSALVAPPNGASIGDFRPPSSDIIYNGTGNATWEINNPNTNQEYNIINNSAFTITLSTVSVNRFSVKGVTTSTFIIQPQSAVRFTSGRTNNIWYVSNDTSDHGASEIQDLQEVLDEGSIGTLMQGVGETKLIAMTVTDGATSTATVAYGIDVMNIQVAGVTELKGISITEDELKLVSASSDRVVVANDITEFRNIPARYAGNYGALMTDGQFIPDINKVNELIASAPATGIYQVLETSNDAEDLQILFTKEVVGEGISNAVLDGVELAVTLGDFNAKYGGNLILTHLGTGNSTYVTGNNIVLQRGDGEGSTAVFNGQFVITDNSTETSTRLKHKKFTLTKEGGIKEFDIVFPEFTDNGTINLPITVDGKSADANGNIELGKYGTATIDSSASTTHLIPHGLGVTPSFYRVNLDDLTEEELRIYKITVDSTNITLTFDTVATNTALKVMWEVRT